MSVSTPTARRRELGARLRRLRLEAGLTITDVAGRMLVSPAKISRLETGDRPPVPRDVRDLGPIYGLAPDTVDDLLRLTQRALEQGWHQGYALSPADDDFVGLEGAAVSIRSWAPAVIPGLLQTDEYTRAVTRPFAAEVKERDPETVSQVRAERRRRLLVDGGPQIHAILDESVLHRQVLPADLMRAQVQRLLDLSERVRIQVLPYAAGAHPGTHGSFVLLGFESAVVSDVVHTEELSSQSFLEKSEELRRYRWAFDELERAADDPDQTRSTLRRLIPS